MRPAERVTPPTMERLSALLTMLAISSCPFTVVGSVTGPLPNGQCSADSVTCQLAGDNLVGIVNGVSGAGECRESLTAESDYFSYYGSAGFPFVDSCLLFSSCEKLDPCTDCFTEAKECAFCEAPVEGSLGSNLISVIDDVSEKEHCIESCRSEELCSMYTFHTANSSTYPSTCFLLSAIGEPIMPCQEDSCQTGFPNCDVDLCTFLDGGYVSPQGVLVTGGQQDRKIDLLRIGNCPNPVVAAVGAGGAGGYSGGYGGGGSGYVDYRANLTSKAFTQMLAHYGVGDSLVTDLSDGSVVVRATDGTVNDGTSGGTGYCGGGGGGYGPPSASGGSGGSDGSNGRGGDSGQGGIAGYGGIGSGFDISQIPLLQNFILSPGGGGGYYGSYGGGGGGVLVDGQGPDGRELKGRGQGYGGGGGYGGTQKDGEEGLPGVTIFDFVSNK